MARKHKSHRPTSKTQRRELWNLRKRAAILAFAAAEDEDEEEDALALVVLCRRELKAARSQKFGLRGAYDAARVDQFYWSLVNEFSDKRFKAWARCDARGLEASIRKSPSSLR
jgi:hypothetical protein